MNPPLAGLHQHRRSGARLGQSPQRLRQARLLIRVEQFGDVPSRPYVPCPGQPERHGCTDRHVVRALKNSGELLCGQPRPLYGGAKRLRRLWDPGNRRRAQSGGQFQNSPPPAPYGIPCQRRTLGSPSRLAGRRLKQLSCGTDSLGCIGAQWGRFRLLHYIS